MKKRVVKTEDTLEHTDETKGGNSECRTLQKGSGGTLNYLSIWTSTQQTLGPEFFINKTHSPTNRTKPFQDPHRTRHPVCHALLETAPLCQLYKQWTSLSLKASINYPRIISTPNPRGQIQNLFLCYLHILKIDLDHAHFLRLLRQLHAADVGKLRQGGHDVEFAVDNLTDAVLGSD